MDTERSPMVRRVGMVAVTVAATLMTSTAPGYAALPTGLDTGLTNVPIYESESLASPVVQRVSSGDRVDAVCLSEDTDMVMVTYPGGDGWMIRDYLDAVPQTECDGGIGSFLQDLF